MEKTSKSLIYLMVLSIMIGCSIPQSHSPIKEKFTRDIFGEIIKDDNKLISFLKNYDGGKGFFCENVADGVAGLPGFEHTWYYFTEFKFLEGQKLSININKSLEDGRFNANNRSKMASDICEYEIGPLKEDPGGYSRELIFQNCGKYGSCYNKHQKYGAIVLVQGDDRAYVEFKFNYAKDIEDKCFPYSFKQIYYE